MKRLIFVFIILFQTCISNAQVWNSVLSGASVQSGLGIYSLINFQDTLFIAGSFDTLGGNYILAIGSWNGSNFQSIGNMYGTPYCYTIHDGELFVGGDIYSINGNNQNRRVSKYFSGSWIPVGADTIPSSNIYCLASFQGNLYAGGNFSAPFNRIAYWDGNLWYSLGTGLSGGVTQARCMAVYHNELYIGGEFGSANGITAYHIVKWNGSSFSAVDGGTDAAVYSMIVDTLNDRLICGGDFSLVGSIGIPTPYGVAAWNDTNWVSLGTGALGPSYFATRTFSFYRGILYQGGAQRGVNQSGDSLNYVSYWDGSDWQPLGKGVDLSVLSMAVYKDELYVGGAFDHAGDSIAHKIARWYMPPLGVEQLKNTNDNINIYPNPVTDKLTVTINNNDPSQIILSDITSRKLLQQSFTNSITLNTAQLAKGIYLYEVRNKNGAVKKGKVVKELE